MIIFNFRQMAVCVLAMLTVGVGSLAAISTTADVMLIGAPATVVQGNLESNDTIFLFQESVGTLPVGGLEVDITSPGSYTGTGTNPNSSIFGEYRSYLFHMDPIGITGGGFASGQVTFDEDIIGIIIDAADLEISDAIVGAPGTAYPIADGTRGLETDDDRIDWTVSLLGPRVLDIRLGTAQFASDQVRVITRAPEPGTYATLGMFLLFAVCAKRRRTQSTSVA
jgi:hypothetical protein